MALSAIMSRPNVKWIGGASGASFEALEGLDRYARL